MKDNSIYVDQDRYATSIVANTWILPQLKASKKFNKNTLPSDMILTKADTSTSDNQVEKLTREFNIHYRACIALLIYLLSTIVDLSFSVHKLAKLSANTGKVHIEGLVHLLRYIRDSKTLVLNYYADMNDAPVSYLLRQASNKNENQFMALSDYSQKDCPYTGISTVSYMIFNQCGKIDNDTHVSGPVDQSSAESEYNVACTAGIDLAHFRMLIH